ncbi:MAG TPA: M20/M25/M40 family metallo-hydrolase, partial [Woeseiaceae bacterium]|nr:M20/M25/M40 family metallo-hydrolase [Woeseiaceae bacterium]
MATGGAVIRRVSLGVLSLAVLLIAVLVANTLLISDRRSEPVRQVDVPVLDAGAPNRLAAAITFETVSPADPSLRAPGPFLAFQAFLERAFPRVHETMARTRVGELSLLYEWPGTDAEAKPVLFLAHQDVVPVADAQAWTQPPFAGRVADGFVWGRGAMDDKSSLLGWLEASERLLANGFRPARTVYLAFGHDEETGGRGAQAIADHLEARGVHLAFVLDEGGFIGRGLLGGIEAPVALVGIAEKGYLTVEVTAEEAGGHSSRPPPETAIGIVGKAVVRLEEHPFPGRLDGAAEALLDRLAPELPFSQRLVIANRWLLEPVLVSVLERNQNLAPLVRTTTAVTMFHAGEKDNVLARQARAVVNLRILPGESVDGTLERIRRIIGDPRVRLRPAAAIGPAPVS